MTGGSETLDDPGPPAMSWFQRHRAAPVVIILLLSAQFIGFGLWEAWRDAPTDDEPKYLAGGVTALTRHDLRINIDQPPLPKVLADLPVLAAHPVIPNDAAWRTASARYPESFLTANQKAGTLRELVFLSRLVPLLEGLLVGLATYVLASQLFGRVAGLLAAFLWFTLPVAIGYSHLNMLDIPFALVAVGGSLVLLRHLRSPTWANAAGVGLVGGVGLLSRWTGLVLVPILAVVVLISAWRRVRRAALQAGCVILIAWLTLWGGYRVLAPGGTQVTDGLLRTYFGVSEQSLPRAPGLGERILESLPFPKEYTAGLKTLRVTATYYDSNVFLLGQHWSGQRWWFWPGTVLIKLPITALLLLLVAPLAWLALDPRRRREALLAVALPAVAIAAATVVQASEGVGVRYLLPVFALGTVIAAAVVVGVSRLRFVRVALGSIILAQLVLFATAIPGSIAWTQPPFRPGYRVGADSTLDLGQDFYRLESWSRGRRPWIAWLGGLPASQIPDSRSLLTADPRTVRGYVAVNATSLTTVYHRKLSWLRAYCPIGTIGGTILLYHFASPPSPRPGPDAPESPCPGTNSHRV